MLPSPYPAYPVVPIMPTMPEDEVEISFSPILLVNHFSHPQPHARGSGIEGFVCDKPLSKKVGFTSISSPHF